MLCTFNFPPKLIIDHFIWLRSGKLRQFREQSNDLQHLGFNKKWFLFPFQEKAKEQRQAELGKTHCSKAWRSTAELSRAQQSTPQHSRGERQRKEEERGSDERKWNRKKEIKYQMIDRRVIRSWQTGYHHYPNAGKQQTYNRQRSRRARQERGWRIEKTEQIGVQRNEKKQNHTTANYSVSRSK